MITPEHGSTGSEPLPSSRGFIITGGVLAVFLAALDTTALATVMPTIAAELGGIHLYSWVFAIYMITSAVSLPIWGKLADMYGKKVLFFVTVAVFILGSVLCGLSGTMTHLILFRGVQGIGAGGLAAIPFALVSSVFPPHERGKAIGAVASAWGVSSVLGPMVGSIIVLSLTWQWIFYINVPVALAAVSLIHRYYEEPPRRVRQQIDFMGALLLCAAIMAFLLLLRLARPGAALSVLPLSLAAGFLLSFTLFLWRETRASNPILELRHFRRRGFWLGNLLGFLASFAMFGVVAFVPLLAQTIQLGTALQAGLVITPMSLSWSGSAIVSGRLAHRLGERTLVWFGMLMMALGLVLSHFIEADTQMGYIILCVVVMGIGMGSQTPSLMLTVQRSLDLQNLGIATSTQMLFRTVGGAVGVSVAGVGILLSMRDYLLQRLPGPLVESLDDPRKLLDPRALALLGPEEGGVVLEAFAGAVQIAFTISLVVVILSLLLSTFLPGRDAPADPPPGSPPQKEPKRLQN
jgi:EmrB/QacA subfamily drug resistance transporter